jgi:hypothetical protein
VPVVLTGFVTPWRYFEILCRRIEPVRPWKRPCGGQRISTIYETGNLKMLKAARSYQSIPESATSSEKSESHPLIPIALFSGIGLLVSLIAILMDSPGAWY